MTTIFETNTIIENNNFNMILIKTDISSTDTDSVRIGIDYTTLTQEEKAIVDSFKALLESKA